MKSFLSTAALVVFVWAPALAHHSYAMFDGEKTLTIEGTVKELQWANPHVWLEVVVLQGATAGNWSFEGGPIQQLKRIGWRSEILKPGDKVTVVAHPLRDGSKGGALMWITLPDGRILQGGGTVAQKTVPDVVEH
jgi:hypothetical protein